jgi:glycosyltransferase involved in cell wall biosynthesis
MTRILFDASTIDDQPSGSKTRIERLVPELEARGHHVTLAVVAWRRGALKRWIRPGALEAAVRRVQADLVVFETWPAPRLEVPTIAVVHDLRHVRAGGLRRTLALSWLRDGAARVRRFHAVSEATRRELEEAVPEARGKIDVVPNAVVVPAPTDEPSPLPEDVDGPFVLAAGHSEPRKMWRFVAALAKDLGPSGVRIVRAGRGVERHPNVQDLGVVDDEELEALFRHAAAVLAPSALEGFGLVPLEALAHGAWVVASAIPAHQEVLGDAADFFAPGDRAAALAALRRAIEATPAERAARIAGSVHRARLYSPVAAAEAFEASLRSAGI